MRAVLVLVAAAALPVALPTVAAAGAIDLRIEFRATASSRPRVLTLHCNATSSGTVKDPAGACRTLQKLLRKAFTPTPRGAACTEIYGGPSTAVITGSYIGFPLWVRLRRDNGCEIGRWERVAFLLPAPASP